MIARMADTLAPEGFVETTSAATPISSFSTLHIARSGGESLFRTRPRAAAEGSGRPRAAKCHRRCRLRRPGEARKSSAGACGRSRGRAQSYHATDLLARGARRKAVDTEFPVDDNSTLAHRALRSRARAASPLRHRAGGLRQICTFCVVPYRGAESPAVIKVVRKWTAGGGAYGDHLDRQKSTPITARTDDGRGAGVLLERIAEIDVSSAALHDHHPCDMAIH